jgi:pyrroline-5-carboxylate reductase
VGIVLPVREKGLKAKLGVIGGGVMAEAILTRLLAEQIYLPSQILVSDPSASRCQFWQDQFGIPTTPHNAEVAQGCDYLLLAIKPQVFPQVAVALTGLIQISPPSLVISILTGVSLQKLQRAFPGIPVIRTMPNTPATVGAGITAISYGEGVTSEDKRQVEQIFQVVGEVEEIAENLLDAVTGLSGSGPGFVAVMIEALIDGGVAVGLSRQVATRLALQTVLGTAQLLQQTGLHPAELKDRVTSPGGTTIAGIAALERAGLRSAIIQAVQAASDRSQSLGT